VVISLTSSLLEAFSRRFSRIRVHTGPAKSPVVLSLLRSLSKVLLGNRTALAVDVPSSSPDNGE
jgi:hypothetical protein